MVALCLFYFFLLYIYFNLLLRYMIFKYFLIPVLFFVFLAIPVFVYILSFMKSRSFVLFWCSFFQFRNHTFLHLFFLLSEFALIFRLKFFRYFIGMYEIYIIVCFLMTFQIHLCILGSYLPPVIIPVHVLFTLTLSCFQICPTSFSF